MRKKVKVQFVDFADTENIFKGYILSLLTGFVDVEVSEEPEYLFYGPHGKKHLDYSCIRIFWQQEELEPDFTVCDYAIGFFDMSYYDRYLYLPVFAYPNYKDTFERVLSRETQEKRRSQNKTKFCNFIYSNGLGDPFREKVFFALCQYKQIDSAGRYLNNMGDVNIAGPRMAENWQESKLRFMEGYRFTIAMSNAQKYGYLDEKIFDAWCAGSIPIYWGDPKVTEFFNPEAFIDCTGCKTAEEVVEKVKEIDENAEKYAAMQNAPILRDQEKVEMYLDERRTRDFLKSIFEQDYDFARRTSGGIRAKEHIQRLRFWAKVEETYLYRQFRRVEYALRKRKLIK